MKRQFFNSSALVLLFSLTIFSSCQSDQESVVPATSSKSNLANRSGLVPKGRLIINNQSPLKFTFDLYTHGYDATIPGVYTKWIITTPVIVPPDNLVDGNTIFDSYLIPAYNYYVGPPSTWVFKNTSTGATASVTGQEANDLYAEDYGIINLDKFAHWDYLRSARIHQEIGVKNTGIGGDGLVYGVDVDVTILLPENTGNATNHSEVVVDLFTQYNFPENGQQILHIISDSSLIDNGDGTVDTLVVIKSVRNGSL